MSDYEPRQPLPLRRIAIAVVGVVAVVMLIGFVSGWLSLSVDRDASTNTVSLSLNLHKRTLQEQAVEAKRDIQAAAEAAKSVGSLSTVEGRIVTLDTETPLLTVSQKGTDEHVTVRLNNATEITVGEDDEAHVDDLHGGEVVTVVYSVKDEVNFAQSVTVHEKTAEEGEAEQR